MFKNENTISCFIAICGPGQAPNVTNTTECIDCEIGFYSDVTAAEQCTMCAANLSTVYIASTMSQECIGEPKLWIFQIHVIDHCAKLRWNHNTIYIEKGLYKFNFLRFILQLIALRDFILIHQTTHLASSVTSGHTRRSMVHICVHFVQPTILQYWMAAATQQIVTVSFMEMINFTN